MTQPLHDRARKMLATGWSTVGRRLFIFALLWWILTGGAPGSWPAGIIVISLATAVSLAVRPSHPWRLNTVGVLHFIPYFLWQSMRGGIDVTRRAFSPALPLAPALLERRIGLESDTARLFFVNTISLLPGTLSAELHEDQVVIHCLDHTASLADDLRHLEIRVAAIFDNQDEPTHE